ncbi:hypothetical protein [Streptomyces sp. DSM 40750]|uniref:hypothetical protein n=1 Tax=Streptomyces sp. DSM 40750 TaxID=2801030 RepID=UPI00214BF0D9|nr:hypothetical protein [Streptomyces sp. DSM 40750]UUU23276.1 hypothetical protein JIX55_25000 [Streptomyces sp. DSM 40750]
MAEHRLDSDRLHAWCQEVSRRVDRLMESFEETHGYPVGDNAVAPVDDDTLGAVALLAAHRPAPEPLLSLYAVLDSVSLPDVGNGYFIHSPSTVIAQLDEYGTVALTGGGHGIVFGSDGGGLFAVGDDGSVHRSGTASWSGEFHAVAAGLEGFLEELLRAIEQFTATGHPGRL